MENVTYDEKVVKVRVKVEVRDDKWYADVVYEGIQGCPIFENKYEEPKQTEKPNKPNLPKTGDGSNMSLYALLMLTLGTLLLLIGYRRRKHAK